MPSGDRGFESSPKPLITLTSDFGDDWAKAQVELVIHSINPEARFLVLSNNVTPYAIIEGAFMIAKSYQFSPKGSIHIGVVDPGVGSERKGLLIRSKDYWFVGPDNGLLYPAASENGVKQVYYLDENILNPGGEATFHGRDVFAKAAARISLGHNPLDFAHQTQEDLINKFILQPNQVVHIDIYGNIKVNSTPNTKHGDEVKLATPQGERIEVPFKRTFAEVPPGALLAYRGSHGTLEIARNQDSAANTLQVKVGDMLTIS